jgi:hypothetical protein
MKRLVCVLAFAASAILFAAPTPAKEHDYQKGVLLQMDSVHCGSSSTNSKTVAGEIVGTDNGKSKTEDLLCQEYVLQTDHVMYRIRPRDDKHPALLPIGETAEFRIDKDKLVLRVPEADDKEREYVVVSMAPRTDTSTASGQVKQ